MSSAADARTPPTHDHFASLEQQAQAVKVALALFLASELLMFSALFALIMSYQYEWPEAFRVGITHNTKALGSINTFILLVSTTVLGVAVEVHRQGRRLLAGALTLVTATLGIAFFVIKMVEYAIHFEDGIFAGGYGTFFSEHHVHGLATFWNLYFLATGLHAIHILCGVGVLAYRGLRIFRGSLTHALEAVALYWSLVDLIWIFLWTLFYLA